MANWVLVTGSSRGLGLHLARAFWEKGWSVVLVSRNLNTLLQLSDDFIQRPDQKMLSFQCDLADSNEVSVLIKNIRDHLPRLDALINNAAVHGPIGPLIENDLMDWKRAFQINLMAPVALCHGLIDLIASSGGGSIINLSGGGATGPRANFTAYASAKAGLVRFSETLAQEVKDKNIRVNCIAPGAMKTALLAEVISSGSIKAGKREFEIAEKITTQGGVPMDRVSQLALFLASNKSNGITGKLISAVWDDWQEWPKHLDELSDSDVYTLRRISGRDRNIGWGDI